MQFRYKAKTAAGETKNGVLTANTEQEVLTFIRANGWIPIDIKEQKSRLKTVLASLPNFNSGWSLKEKSLFYRQFAVMLAAGIPIEKTLSILAEQTLKKKQQQIVNNLLSDIRKGFSVASAFNKQRNYFGKLEIAMVKAGEEAGLLAPVLQRVSELLKKQDELHKKIVAALSYPLLVLIVAVTVLILMTVFVLPQFENTFHQMNIQMPAFSSAVFAFGKWLRSYGIAIPFFIFLLLSLLTWLKHHSAAFSYKLDAIKLRLPIVGGIILKASLSRSFRTLGLMLAAGVNILPALQFSGNVSDNAVIKESFNEMFAAAKEGKTLYNTLSRNNVYPLLVGQIVKIGEETGKTDEKFLELASLFEEEMDNTVRQLNTVLEPLLVVIVGLLVATMLFAVYMPILGAVKNFI